MVFSLWFWILFMASWLWILKFFDFMASDKSPVGAYQAAMKVEKVSAMLGLGASYIHTRRFMSREIANHNMRDEIAYTFKLESKLLDNNVNGDYVDNTIPDCVLNAYAVSCHQRLFN